MYGHRSTSHRRTARGHTLASVIMAHQQPHQVRQGPRNKPQPPTPASDQNPFPPATSIIPTIFTPFQGDTLTAPFNPPSGRINILNAKIQALNENYKNVRANILAMMRRECARIVWNAKAEEAQLRAAGKGDVVNMTGTEIVSEEELDHMIQRMTIEGSGEMRARPLSMPDIQRLRSREGISFREKVTLDIEITVGQGLLDPNGYKAHYEKTKARYKDLLHYELERDMQMDATMGPYLD